MSEIRELLEQYIADSNALYQKKTGIKNALSASLGGTNEIKKDPMHLAFYQNVERCVEELAAEGDQEACTEAFQLLLTEREPSKDLVQRGWLQAAETLALPLVPYVPEAVLRPAWERYGSRYPRRERMPKQQALYRAMAEQLGEPKRRWK